MGILSRAKTAFIYIAFTLDPQGTLAGSTTRSIFRRTTRRVFTCWSLPTCWSPAVVNTSAHVTLAGYISEASSARRVSHSNLAVWTGHSEHVLGKGLWPVLLWLVFTPSSMDEHGSSLCCRKDPHLNFVPSSLRWKACKPRSGGVPEFFRVHSRISWTLDL